MGEVQSGGATTSLLVPLEYAVKGVLYIVVLYVVGTIIVVIASKVNFISEFIELTYKLK